MLAPSVLAGALLLLVLDGVNRSEPHANVVIAGPTPTAPNPRAAEERAQAIHRAVKAEKRADLLAAQLTAARTALEQSAGVARQPAGTAAAASDYYFILGVATAPKNAGHRSWIRETWMTLPNVQRSMRAFFLIGSLASDGTVHPERVRRELATEQAVHGDIEFLNARETKPPGEKMIGFFRLCVMRYPDAKFCVKTDDDAYVHTVRLEHNLRALLDGKTNVPVAPPGPYLYVGATLWASYIEQSFEVCGHGMGPNMAAGAAHTEKCAARGAVGPFPYVAGTLEVLSMPLASWMVAQPAVASFVQRAHARNPPAWNIGEDTVLGMWVHASPFPITALHWGWDKIHDLCFKCKDKTQLWKPVTDQSVVVHIKGHQALRHNFVGVHQNFTAVCDDACLRATLSFDVASLKDLCGRGTISRSYSKCKLVM